MVGTVAGGEGGVKVGGKIEEWEFSGKDCQCQPNVVAGGTGFKEKI